MKRRINNSFFCEGCQVTFQRNKFLCSPASFIKRHMKQDEKCRIAIVHCKPCGKEFMNKQHFRSHLTRSNIECTKYHNQKAIEASIASSYATTEVKIKLPTKRCSEETKPNVISSLENKPRIVIDTTQTPHDFLFSNSQKITSDDLTCFSKKRKVIHQIDNCIKENKDVIDVESDNNSISNHSYNSTESSSSIVVTKTTHIDESNDNSKTNDAPDGVTFKSSERKKRDIVRDILNLESRHEHELEVNFEKTTYNTVNDNNLFNENLLLYISSFKIKETPSSNECDINYRDGLTLIKYMIQKDFPLSSYNDLMKWKHNNITTKFYYLKKMIKLTESRVYGETFADLIRPKRSNIICPSGRKTVVITSDPIAAIVDLLSDLNLTDIHNMNIFENEENPFVQSNSDYYSDLNEGELYRSTTSKIVSDNTKEYHVNIILTMDEACMDAYSNLSAHPVMITLGIYNRKTRSMSSAWRSIGYLPNFDQQVGGSRNYSADEKLNDFHFCLNHILTNVRCIQTPTGMLWDFKFSKFPGKTYRRKLLFTLSHVISDAKENDMLCGRMSNRSKTKRLCRDCDVLLEDSDNPNIVCNFLSMYDILKMNEQSLQDHSFKKIFPYNAFQSMNFGNNPYGINLATPADPLHQVLGGIVERLPSSFLQRLSGKQVDLLDNHVSYLANHFYRQSERYVMNIQNFKYGISKASRLTATEKKYRLLVIYLTLLTYDFQKEVVGKKGRKPTDVTGPATTISQTEYNNWLQVFEETVIFVHWVYLEEHPKALFNGGRNSVVAERLRQFMRIYKNHANRTEGMGLKILKFHQISHLWMIIRLYGSLCNIDSSRPESFHKQKK